MDYETYPPSGNFGHIAGATADFHYHISAGEKSMDVSIPLDLQVTYLATPYVKRDFRGEVEGANFKCGVSVMLYNRGETGVRYANDGGLTDANIWNDADQNVKDGEGRKGGFLPVAYVKILRFIYSKGKTIPMPVAPAAEDPRVNTKSEVKSLLGAEYQFDDISFKRFREGIGESFFSKLKITEKKKEQYDLIFNNVVLATS